MKRNVTTWLVLGLFLWVQAAIVLHSAEHGLADHEHHGKRCELCVFSKHSDAVPPSVTIVAPIAIAAPVDIPSYTFPVILARDVGEHPTRAPPYS